MSDIFGYNRSGRAKGVLSSENSLLTFGGSTSVEGYLVQSWSVTYAQSVQEAFEIGSNNLYWIKGRPTGAGSVSRLVAFKPSDASPGQLFPKEAYDVCLGGATLTFTAASGKCDTAPEGGYAGGASVRLTMYGCVVTQIGFSQSVTDFVIHQDVQWRFGSLDQSFA